LIVGNCGPGAWGTWVHERGPLWNEGGDASRYDAADCQQDRTARQNHASFRRIYEDSTWLTAMVDGGNARLSTAGIAAMVRCGVNIIGMDQLTPDDGRLAALVWSWATNEPTAGAGDCAYQGGDGRFHAGDCGQRRHFACTDGAGTWRVTESTGQWSRGFKACAHAFGTSFAAPANGYRNQLIVEAKASPGDEVWVNYAQRDGTWTPNLRSS